MSLISVIKDIIIGCAAIIGSIVALRGLRTWQDQIKGKTEYEVARRVLRGVLSIRDAISVVRSPFISSGEFAEAYKKEGKGIPTKHTSEGDAFVYKQRWEPLQKARAELHLDLLEAEAIWGKDVSLLEVKLNTCIVNLFSAVEMHLFEINNPRPDTSRKVEEREKRMTILYRLSDQPEKDPFLKSIIDVIELFEQFFRPKLIFR